MKTDLRNRDHILVMLFKAPSPSVPGARPWTYAPTPFFSLRIAVLLLLLLNRTDGSSNSGDVYKTGHTEWWEDVRAVRMHVPWAERSESLLR